MSAAQWTDQKLSACKSVNMGWQNFFLTWILVFRPAVVLSYLLAGFTAFLAGLSYLEFAVDQPIAGGAFSYISLVFGELPAWCPPTWHAGFVNAILFLAHQAAAGQSA